MTKWTLIDKGADVYIHKGESLIDAEPKLIYESPKLKFYIMYNLQNKVIGYHCKYEENIRKFTTYNSFGVVYSDTPENGKITASQEMIFEDQVIRFIAYDYNGERDYWLIGRWKS